jgi:hypothetical protein
MSPFDDLDSALEILRGPATETELAAEEQVVGLMAANHRPGSGPKRSGGRRSHVAAILAAGVIGVGGVAAAGPGGLGIIGSSHGSSPGVVDEGSVPATVPDPAVTTIDTGPATERGAVADESPSLRATDGASGRSDDSGADASRGDDQGEDDEVAVYGALPDPDPSTAFNEAYCVEGSLGRTVSAVALGRPPFEDVSVHDAAQSSCGTRSTTGEPQPDGEAPPSKDGDPAGGPPGGPPGGASPGAGNAGAGNAGGPPGGGNPGAGTAGGPPGGGNPGHGGNPGAGTAGGPPGGGNPGHGGNPGAGTAGGPPGGGNPGAGTAGGPPGGGNPGAGTAGGGGGRSQDGG